MDECNDVKMKTKMYLLKFQTTQKSELATRTEMILIFSKFGSLMVRAMITNVYDVKKHKFIRENQ